MIDSTIIKNLIACGRQQRAEDLEIERLKVKAEGGSIGTGSAGSHASARPDRMESAAVKLADRRQEINTERRKRTPKKLESMAAAWKDLPAAQAYVLVCLCYFGMNVDQIAQACGMSVRWVYQQMEAIEK